MDYDAFLTNVAERADVSREQAEALTRATLAVLADRISGGQARHLAAELPEPMKGWLESEDEIAKGYGVHGFARRVRDRAGVPAPLVEPGIRAVFATLREAVSEKEFRDATVQLPKEYDVLLPRPASHRGSRP
jgi:uncharacterized protein (DUF2267 family)